MKPKYLNVINNEAYLHNYKLSSLAKEYHTPLLVFDEVELSDNMDTYLNHFKHPKYHTNIVYASKAFLCPHLLKMLTSKGLWMDAVSLGDLYIAQKASFNLEHVIFHGNNKSIDELKFAINHHCVIVCDNYSELTKIITLANELNTDVFTMFRVNPGISAHTHKYIQTSNLTSKFGESMFDEQLIDKIMSLYLANPNVKLLGFHSHIGSQIQEIEPFLMNVERMMKFSSLVEKKYHYVLPSINFGGGFGIKYLEDESALNIALCMEKMIEKVDELSEQLSYHPTNLFIEPGRSILGNSCVTLYTCNDLKHTSGNVDYIFIDGGMTDNIRPSLYEAEYGCDIVSKMNQERNCKYTLAGKCCESGDIIIRDYPLPQAEVNDIICVYATGAYTYAMSSNYNNMLKPAVIFVNKTNVKQVIKRESLDDLMRNFVDC